LVIKPLVIPHSVNGHRAGLVSDFTWKVIVLSDAAKAEKADDKPTKTLRAMIFYS
jgi:hypothetical protein